MTETATVAHDLFVSYAEADRAWVDGFLLDALDQAGARYHSEDAFALGVPRLVEFERAIKQSTRTLLVLSPAYLADTFGQFVDVLVNSYGMETATWPVIPLILQPIDEPPPRLSQLVKLDATSEAGQQAVLAKLCAELKRPVPGPAPLPACPYPGMVPFDEADAARFFGREQEVQELIERLRLHPFVAVIGASGSGKSSLVRAGLIPALRKSRLFGAGEWTVRVMRPGAAPLAALAAVNVVDLLNAQQSGGRTLLVVDQCEETFTLAGEQGAQFQQTLLQLAAAPGCYVALTARADFYADLMTSPLWEQIQGHRAEVTPLSEAGLRRAIVRPAEQAGVAIEAALVERLLADAAGEPGVLPLIQETLVLLWEHLERRFLPMRAYEALVLTRGAYGAEPTGLQVAIARRADATLASLTETQQPIARRIFLRLIQFGEGRADTRRQQPLSALRSSGDDPAAFDATLQRLAESRLITLSGAETADDRRPTIDDSSTHRTKPSSIVHRPSSSNVDISHEALIRGWPTLQGWLKERREGELTRRRLEGKAQEWLRLGRGNGGLLDEIEVLEAERWLASDDAAEMGFDEALPELVVYSRAELEAEEQAKEAARQRELAQAQALAEEQQRRAEEQAAASQRLRRRAVFLMGALGAAVVAVVFAIVFLFQATTSYELARKNEEKADKNAQLAQQQAQQARQSAAEAENQKRQAVAQSRLARAGELAAQSKSQIGQNPVLSLLLAIEALNVTSIPGDSRVVAAEQSLRDALAQAGGHVLAGDLMHQTRPAASADGRRIALVGQDGMLRIWDLSQDEKEADPQIVNPGSPTSSYSEPVFSSDWGWVAISDSAGRMRVLHLAADDPAGHPLLLPGIDEGGPSNALAFSPDGRRVAARDDAGNVRLIDLSAPDPLASAKVLNGRLTDDDTGSGGTDDRVMFSPDGRWLLLRVSGSPTFIWDTTLPDPNTARIALPDPRYAPIFSPDNRWLAMDDDTATLLWNMSELSRNVEARTIPGGPYSQFSPDGRWLLTPGGNGDALLWAVASLDRTAEPHRLDNIDLRHAMFSPDGSRLAAAHENDSNVQVWTLKGASPETARMLPEAGAPLALSSDGSQIMTANGPVGQVWQLGAGDPDTPPLTLRGHAESIFFAMFTPDERSVISVALDDTARIWDLAALHSAADPSQFASELIPGLDPTADETPPQTIALPPGVDSSAKTAHSSDGRRLVTYSRDGAHVWDLTATPIASVYETKADIFKAVLSPDGRTMVAEVNELDGSRIELWDLAKPASSTNPVPISADWIVVTEFSPDSRMLLIGGDDTAAHLWDLTAIYSGTDQIKERGVLPGHERRDSTTSSGAAVTKAVFSPDPRHLMLMTASGTGKVRLWDLTSAAIPQPIILLAESQATTDLYNPPRMAFRADGRAAIAIDSSGQMHRWPLALDELIRQGCALAGRNLSWQEWQQYFSDRDYHTTCWDLSWHRSWIEQLLDEADTQAEQGKIADALTGYSNVQQLSPQYSIGGAHWNTLCRSGVLAGHVKDVLNACGRAVVMDQADVKYRDSRGLARALTGDASGAIEDFEAYIAWAQAADPEGNKQAIDQRKQWIADLEADRQPFNEATLKALREAELSR